MRERVRKQVVAVGAAVGSVMAGEGAAKGPASTLPVQGALRVVEASPKVAAPVRPGRVQHIAERLSDPELAEVFARAAAAWERWAVRKAAGLPATAHS